MVAIHVGPDFSGFCSDNIGVYFAPLFTKHRLGMKGKCKKALRTVCLKPKTFTLTALHEDVTWRDPRRPRSSIFVRIAIRVPPQNWMICPDRIRVEANL
jgi:hypothetical protein